MMKLRKRNIAKVVSLLLAMAVLLSIPVAAAQASTCYHRYSLVGSYNSTDSSSHNGPYGPCTIYSNYRVNVYVCQNGCGSNNINYTLLSTTHSACK